MMSTSSPGSRRLLAGILLASAATALAGPTRADDLGRPRLSGRDSAPMASSGATTIALETEPGQRRYCRNQGGLEGAEYWRDYVLAFPLVAVRHPCTAADESVARQVETDLVPALESRGYRVERVWDAQKAVASRAAGVGVRLDVDAKPIYLLHSAAAYGKDTVAEYDTGASAWGQYQVFRRDGTRVVTAQGRLGPFQSQVQPAHGAGRALLDDEEAVARLLGDAAAQAIQAALEGRPAPVAAAAPAPPPEARAEKPRREKPPKAPRPPKQPKQREPSQPSNRDRWAR